MRASRLACLTIRAPCSSASMRFLSRLSQINEDSGPWLRRARTRARLEARAISTHHRVVVRAGQCRHCPARTTTRWCVEIARASRRARVRARRSQGPESSFICESLLKNLIEALEHGARIVKQASRDARIVVKLIGYFGCERL